MIQQNAWDELPGEPHQCHFCGTWVLGGLEVDGQRHWLSDCRPDLVQHDKGHNCTWSGTIRADGAPDCYAYQNKDTFEWTNDHIYFVKDGPT